MKSFNFRIIPKSLGVARKLIKPFIGTSLRRYGVVFNEEYNVSQFCNFTIKCPHNVCIRPIDLLEHVNNDCIKIKLNSSSNTKPNIKCDIDNSQFTVIDNTSRVPEDSTFEIQLPMTASEYMIF